MLFGGNRVLTNLNTIVKQCGILKRSNLISGRKLTIAKKSTGTDVAGDFKIHNILTKLGKYSITSVDENMSIKNAISFISSNAIPAMLVTDSATTAAKGIYTASDILRYLDKHGLDNVRDTIEHRIKNVITPVHKLVYCSPMDSVQICREIMYQSKVRNMVIIDKGIVLGLINIRELSDVMFNIHESGSKTHIYKNLVGRRGNIPSDWTLLPCKNVSRYLSEHFYDKGGSGGLGLGADAPSVPEECTSEVYKTSMDHNLDTDIRTTHSKTGSKASRKDISSGDGSGSGLHLSVGASILPHPFKRQDRSGVVARNRRDYGLGKELAVDLGLCEDAYLVTMFPSGDTVSSLESCRKQTQISGNARRNNRTLSDPQLLTPTQPTGTASADVVASMQSKRLNDRMCYMCVADGVGGWREYGIDPRLYAYTLVEHAKKSMLNGMLSNDTNTKPKSENETVTMRAKHPDLIITEAWESTEQYCIQTENMINSGHSGPEIRKIQGSSTLCIATIDLDNKQLEYSNIGDSGLMVLRRIGSDRASYSRSKRSSFKDSTAGSDEDTSATKPLEIAYIAQQQLKSFNLPYQLGYSPIPEYMDRFESPADADTASIPLFENDVILLATDGLFDNISLDEIVEIVNDWDRIYIQSQIPIAQDKKLKILTDHLTALARKYSLDTSRDSPFGLLAKDNDILWQLGGKPDDTVIIAARVHD